MGTSSGRMVTEGRKSDPDRNGIKVKGIIFSLPSCFNRHEISSRRTQEYRKIKECENMKTDLDDKFTSLSPTNNPIF